MFLKLTTEIWHVALFTPKATLQFLTWAKNFASFYFCFVSYSFIGGEKKQESMYAPSEKCRVLTACHLLALLSLVRAASLINLLIILFCEAAATKACYKFWTWVSSLLILLPLLHRPTVLPWRQKHRRTVTLWYDLVNPAVLWLPALKAVLFICLVLSDLLSLIVYWVAVDLHTQPSSL